MSGYRTGGEKLKSLSSEQPSTGVLIGWLAQYLKKTLLQLE